MVDEIIGLKLSWGGGAKIRLLILEELVCESWDGGEKSPVFQQRLVSVSAFWNNFVAFVESFSRIGCGDKCFFKETQVTHPHFPAVGRGQPEDWPIGCMRNLFTFQVPNMAWQGGTVCLVLVLKGSLVRGKPLLESVGRQADVLLVGVGRLHLAFV